MISFGLPKGSSSDPTSFNFTKGAKIDVVVYILGSYPEQISFILRTYTGATVATMSPGTKFTADSNILTFCVECINYDPV